MAEAPPAAKGKLEVSWEKHEKSEDSRAAAVERARKATAALAVNSASFFTQALEAVAKDLHKGDLTTPATGGAVRTLFAGASDEAAGDEERARSLRAVITLAVAKTVTLWPRDVPLEAGEFRGSTLAELAASCGWTGEGPPRSVLEGVLRLQAVQDALEAAAGKPVGPGAPSPKRVGAPKGGKGGGDGGGGGGGGKGPEPKKEAVKPTVPPKAKVAPPPVPKVPGPQPPEPPARVLLPDSSKRESASRFKVADLVGDATEAGLEDPLSERFDQVLQAVGNTQQPDIRERFAVMEYETIRHLSSFVMALSKINEKKFVLGLMGFSDAVTPATVKRSIQEWHDSIGDTEFVMAKATGPLPPECVEFMVSYFAEQ